MGPTGDDGGRCGGKSGEIKRFGDLLAECALAEGLEEEILADAARHVGREARGDGKVGGVASQSGSVRD